MQIDHVFAKARGGQDDFGNLVTACASCNGRKSDNLGTFPYPVGYFKRGIVSRLFDFISRAPRVVPEFVAVVDDETNIVAPTRQRELPEFILGLYAEDLEWLCDLLAEDRVVNKRPYGRLPLPHTQGMPAFDTIEGGLIFARWKRVCIELGIVEGWEKTNKSRALIQDNRKIFNLLADYDRQLQA